ncbi:hypothetical protein CNMCM5793_000744 [Aspergillus hiratsukae]|uniref:P-loop containing nucleoside triphosphate hydrolase protein n=1 Tax=Aspergillus hiratsukae TaxID=1194566 RepID=A0A8H6P2K0_9EURO|nr:hypothetical protein CNMCM5793_000744 [Aspergillus hiratsukae]KAF7166115.1 hypothetical protein CNMCM6106_002073 [Aspergillus hiratsukae]
MTGSERSRSSSQRSHREVNEGEQENKKQSQASFRSYLRIFTYTDRVGWVLNVLALVAAVGAGSALPLLDLLMGKMITNFNDYGTGARDSDEFLAQLNQLALYLVYLFVAKLALAYIWTMSISISSLRTTKALRIAYLTHLLKQDISFFDSSDSTSPVVHVTNNTNLVNQGTSEKLGFAIQGCGTFVSAFIVAFAVQWKLTLITICTVPGILIVTGICFQVWAKQETQILKVDAEAATLSEEVLSTMKTVHAFSAAAKLLAKYDSLAKQSRRLLHAQSWNGALLYSVEFFCVYCGYGLAFWQGVRLVILAVIVASTAMSQVAPQIIQITKAASAAHELWRVIDQEPSIGANEDGIRPDSCEGVIQFTKVDFAYPSRPSESVFQGFSLHIPAGKSTALVGSSGSGKSTLAGLLQRWYDVNGGSILLDGRDIRRINTKWLRTQIRIVQQEPTLFNGTVFENVVYGLAGTEHLDSPREQQMDLVIEACKAAYAHDFIIELPQGYDTPIMERAALLSGGQKQRIAIARSIISNPKVLILDEATSALETKAERIVQEALDNVSAKRTTITIAHKLATIKKADQIVVLRQGCIMEQGTHDELNAAHGMYHRLLNIQHLGDMQPGKPRASGDDHGEPDISHSKQYEQGPGGDDLTPMEKFNPRANYNYTLLTCLYILLKERRQLWSQFAFMFIASAAGGGSYPVLNFIFAKALNVFQETSKSEMVSRGDFWALMLFVLALVILVVYATIGWLGTSISAVIVYVYRLEILRSYLQQDMTFYDQPQHTIGALVTQLSTTATNLQELLGFNMSVVLIALVNITSSSILSISVGWKLGLVVLAAAMIPIVFCGYLRVRMETKLQGYIAHQFDESAALAGEAIAAIRTVVSLTIEQLIIGKYKDRLAGIEQRSIKSLVWTSWWLALTQSLSLLSMALSFWYGGRLLASGEYSTTQLYIVVIGFTRGRTACNYVFWLRHLRPSVRDSSSIFINQEDTKSDLPAQLTLQNVSFRYPTRPNHTVLEGLNISIQPGQFVAFVGPSGHGKSSIISLIERYYNPSAGVISLDGTEIASMPLAAYRRNLSLVQQEPVLYQGSIRENIALGVQGDATDSQILDACRDANILDFVSSLPDGLDTACGPRGQLLSGGQRQRIAIARALIQNPRLLLLDEATSALDTESEKVVQSALMAAKNGRTTIAIAHRLSTVQHSDCIFVLVNGRIKEQGTHEDLIRRKEVYYEMCLGQALDNST